MMTVLILGIMPATIAIAVIALSVLSILRAASTLQFLLGLPAVLLAGGPCSS